MVEDGNWGPMSDDKTRKAVLSDLQQQKGPQESFLIEIHGPSLGKNYPVTEDVITIGRDASATIQIDQENVSRLHCKLETLRGATYIEDLNSTNGTYVNDVPVQRERLRHGDLLKMYERGLQTNKECAEYNAPLGTIDLDKEVW